MNGHLMSGYVMAVRIALATIIAEILQNIEQTHISTELSITKVCL